MNEAQLILYLRKNGVAKIDHNGPTLAAAQTLADQGLVSVLTDRESDGYSMIRLSADRRKQAAIQAIVTAAMVPVKVRVAKGAVKVAKIAGRAVQSYATSFKNDNTNVYSDAAGIGLGDGGMGIDTSQYPGLQYSPSSSPVQLPSKKPKGRVVVIGGRTFVAVPKQKKKSQSEFIIVNGRKYRRA